VASDSITAGGWPDAALETEPHPSGTLLRVAALPPEVRCSETYDGSEGMRCALPLGHAGNHTVDRTKP